MKKILRYTLILILIFISICSFACTSVVQKSEQVEFNLADHVVEVDEGENSLVTITFAGDVMLHMPTVRAYYNKLDNSYDFSPIFKYVKQINDGADLSVVNLETVINPEVPLSGFPRFNSPTEIINGLKFGGYDIIGTGNNHAYDQGEAGVLSTIAAIKNDNLIWMGTNVTSADNRARVIEINNIKLGFTCYTYGLNGFVPANEHSVNILGELKLNEDISYLKGENVDKIILFVHWGTEYRSEPTNYMKNMAEMAFNSGVDYIVGSHPHVVSNVVETENKDKFVAYSLGNLVSNQRSEFMEYSGTEDGLILKITLEKDYYTKETKLNSIESIPTWLYRYHDGKWHYEIIPIDMALNGELDSLELTDGLIKKLIESKNRTTKILESNNNGE